MEYKDRCKRNVTIIPSFNNKNSRHFEGDPVQGLLCVEIPSTEGVIYRHQSDISLLFQQKKLNKSEHAALANHFATPTKSAYSDGNYTDEQLLSFIKPRHVQGLAEMKAWSEYLLAKADELKSDYEDFIAEQQAAAAQAAVTTEPTPAPSSENG